MSANAKRRRRQWRSQWRVKPLTPHEAPFFSGVRCWFSADPYYATVDEGGRVTEWRDAVGGAALRPPTAEQAPTLETT